MIKSWLKIGSSLTVIGFCRSTVTSGVWLHFAVTDKTTGFSTWRCHRTLKAWTLYGSTLPWYLWRMILTINPGNSYTFKECHPQKAHTASCIVIEQLENVHATLQGDRQANKSDTGALAKLNQTAKVVHTVLKRSRKTKPLWSLKQMREVSRRVRTCELLLRASMWAHACLCPGWKPFFFVGILNLKKASVAIKRCCHGNDRGRERAWTVRKAKCCLRAERGLGGWWCQRKERTRAEEEVGFFYMILHKKYIFWQKRSNWCVWESTRGDAKKEKLKWV